MVLYSERKEPVDVTLHVRERAPSRRLLVPPTIWPRPRRRSRRAGWPGSSSRWTARCRAAVRLVLAAQDGRRLVAPDADGPARVLPGLRRRWQTRVDASLPGQYYACLTDRRSAIACDYRPENVINGVARIVGTTTNQWASDPAQPMPQWLELTFPNRRR